MVAKTLRPLPNEYKPLSDEARVRLRYVDMIVNPESRSIVRTKATVLRTLRSVLDGQDFVEVETPVLQLTNGGAAARPFRTHLNAFDQPVLLRIALSSTEEGHDQRRPGLQSAGPQRGPRLHPPAEFSTEATRLATTGNGADPHAGARVGAGCGAHGHPRP
jgi:hypothetical protein